MNYIRVTKENIDKEHICCAMSGEVLQYYSKESCGYSAERRLFVAELHEHFSRWYAKEEVGKEIHGVSEHSDGIGVGIFGKSVFPYYTDWCGKICYEGNHAE